MAPSSSASHELTTLSRNGLASRQLLLRNVLRDYLAALCIKSVYSSGSLTWVCVLGLPEVWRSEERRGMGSALQLPETNLNSVAPAQPSQLMLIIAPIESIRSRAGSPAGEVELGSIPESASGVGVTITSMCQSAMHLLSHRPAQPSRPSSAQHV